MFCSIKRGGGGYKYTFNERSGAVRCFPTAKVAEKYLAKNIHSLDIMGERFEVCMVKAAA